MKMEVGKELREILGLAESTSADTSEWWEKLPGKKRRKVCDILGISKSKDISDYASMTDDEQSEVETFYSKHKGRVEEILRDGEVLSEGFMDESEIKKGVLLIARDDGDSYRKKDVAGAIDKASKEYVDSVSQRLKDDISEMKKELVSKLKKIWKV